VLAKDEVGVWICLIDGVVWSLFCGNSLISPLSNSESQKVEDILLMECCSFAAQFGGSDLGGQARAIKWGMPDTPD
jgi:hypothetical protein